MEDAPGTREAKLSELFDAHVAAEFQTKDAEGTMATMVDDPTVIHVPVLTGGRDTEQLRAFYRDHFIPSWPEDVETEPISRTVDGERVVDEFITRFTHTREMPFWLPGIPPTGRKVELPMVVIMGFRGDQVSFEHIYWDQASLLAQLGLWEPGSLPVVGAEQARALSDPSVPVNTLLGS